MLYLPVTGAFVAYIAFGNRDIKIRAERFLSSITNSFEIVLRQNIEVRLILLPDSDTSINSERRVVLPDPIAQKQMHKTEVTNAESKVIYSNEMYGYSDIDSYQEPSKVSRGSFNDSEGKLARSFESAAESPALLVEGNGRMNGTKERKPVAPVQRIESIIHEQRLETAWLQTAEKGTPGSMSRLKPERNQVLPQDGIDHQNHMESTNLTSLTSQHWEDELKDELKALKIIDGKEAFQKDQVGKRVDHYQMSPSLLHNSGYISTFSKENM